MKSRLRVLVIDDTVEDAELLELDLARAGYDFFMRRVDSAEGLRRELLAPEWDLIISDYSMPSFTGLDALKICKASGWEIPFILMSGQIGEDVAAEAMVQGASDYIMKDKRTRLIPAIEREMRESHLRREKRKGDTRFRTLFETMTQGIVYYDAQGCVTSANPSAQRMLGKYLDEMRQKTIWKTSIPLIREDGTPFLFDDLPVIVALRTGKPVLNVVLGGYLESSQELTWLLVNDVPLFDPGDASPCGVYSTLTDITERTHLRSVLVHNEERLKSLLHLSQLSGLTAQELMDYALEEIIRLTGSTVGYLFFYNEDTRQFTVYSWSKNAMDQCRVLDRPWSYELDQAGLWGETVRQRKPVVTNDYNAPDVLRKGLPEGHMPLVRHMSVPVFLDNRIVAVVGVGNKATCYTDDDVRQLELYANGLWQIAERKLAEQVLAESEERFHSLFDDSPLAIWELDLSEMKSCLDCLRSGDIQNLRAYLLGHSEVLAHCVSLIKVLSVNQESVTFFGGGKREDIPKRFPTYLIDESWPIFIDTAVTLAEGKGRFESEIPIRDKVGNQRILFFRVSMSDTNRETLGRVLICFLDITERRRAEAALRESSLLNQAMINSAEEGIIVCDNDLKYLVWNPYMVQMSGIPASQVIGKHPQEVFPFVAKSRLVDRLKRALAGETLPPVEYYYNVPDANRIRWTSDNSAPLRDAQGKIVGVISTVRDITERKYSEEMLLFLAQRGWMNEGEEFFPALVQYLAKVLHVACALVARHKEDGQSIETVALSVDGVLVPNREYALKDIPCVKAIEGVICSYAENVQALFPLDLIIKEMRAESYVGLPLWTSTGAPIGLIAVMDNAPMSNVRITESLLRLAEGRVAAELERQQADQALRESEARFHNAILESPFPIMLHADDGEILMISRSWSEITGYTQADAPTIHDWIIRGCGMLREYNHEQIEKLYALEERRDEGEFVITTRSGEKRIWDFSSAPLGRSGGRRIVISMAKDITERKRAEEEANRLVTAVEQAAEAVLITDPQAHILYVNPAFTRITGYLREEVLGQTPRILNSGRQDRSFYKALWGTLLSGKVWTGHFVNKRKDGGLYEAECTISPVRDATGAIINYVALKRDVTHELELKQQLHQAQKMEAIGTLAGGIAHDFNNILQSIMGYAELARSETPENTQARMSMVEVLTASERASELVAQILAFSRLSENERIPVQIQQVLRDALKLLRGSLPSNIEIHSQIDESCCPVLADPTRIQQVIMNLCTNAYHAMRESGGVLRVQLEPSENESDQPLFAQEKPLMSYVKLTVTDTGCGMDNGTTKRIFEPYFTTKKLGEGTGLGLSVVHGIVRELEGTILVDSTPGKGTQFRVFLPACFLVAKPTQEKTPLDDNELRGSERVLLVDDEASAVRMMDIALRQLGYDVASYTDSMEALTAFQVNPAQYDIVVTDQTMPQLTGIQLVDELLMIRPDLPIILCSGYSDVVDETLAKAKGVREFLTKPFLPNKLLETIRSILDTKSKEGTLDGTDIDCG